eukprot:2817156-Rhodomonas_salina.5
MKGKKHQQRQTKSISTSTLGPMQSTPSASADHAKHGTLDTTSLCVEPKTSHHAPMGGPGSPALQQSTTCSTVSEPDTSTGLYQ